MNNKDLLPLSATWYRIISQQISSHLRPRSQDLAEGRLAQGHAEWVADEGDGEAEHELPDLDGGDVVAPVVDAVVLLGHRALGAGTI